MEITEYWLEARFSSETFWIEVLAADERCKTRAEVAGLIWQEAEPGLLVIRIPAHRDDGLAESGPVGPLVRRGILGLTDVIGRPAFLNEPWISQPHREIADARTRPDTDARLVELAVAAQGEQLHPREREAIVLYLEEISRVQHDFGIPPGTGEQTFRFVSHYWSLGDVGVGQKFAALAPRLRGQNSLRASEVDPRVGTPSRTSLDNRLLTLERGIRQRQLW